MLLTSRRNARSQKGGAAMSDTPRTDAAYFKKGATMYSVAEEMKKIECELLQVKLELLKYTKDSEDDSLYNVRRLRNQISLLQTEKEKLIADMILHERMTDRYQDENEKLKNELSDALTKIEDVSKIMAIDFEGLRLAALRIIEERDLLAAALKSCIEEMRYSSKIGQPINDARREFAMAEKALANMKGGNS